MLVNACFGVWVDRLLQGGQVSSVKTFRMIDLARRLGLEVGDGVLPLDVD